MELIAVNTVSARVVRIQVNKINKLSYEFEFKKLAGVVGSVQPRAYKVTLAA